MNKERDLTSLRQITQLMLDKRLNELKHAAHAKQHSEDALKDLGRTPPEFEGLLGASGALAALLYDQWADSRRLSLNQLLARQTHDWLEARDAARVAFGKAEVLHNLARKSRT